MPNEKPTCECGSLDFHDLKITWEQYDEIQKKFPYTSKVFIQNKECPLGRAVIIEEGENYLVMEMP